MTPTISRTFTTYDMQIVRLYVDEAGAPCMEPLEEWSEEVVGVLGNRAARKLAVTHHGGRLPSGCQVVATPVRADVYAMPAEQFKAMGTLVSTTLPDEAMDALSNLLEDDSDTKEL